MELYSQHYATELLFILGIFLKTLFIAIPSLKIPTIFTIFLQFKLTIFNICIGISFFLFSKFLPMKVRAGLQQGPWKKSHQNLSRSVAIFYLHSSKKKLDSYNDVRRDAKYQQFILANFSLLLKFLLVVYFFRCRYITSSFYDFVALAKNWLCTIALFL